MYRPEIDCTVQDDSLILEVAEGSDPCCDFCGQIPVLWSYEVTDFEIDKLPDGTSYMSSGGWAACDPCKILLSDTKLTPREIDQKLCGRAMIYWEEHTNQPRYVLEQYRHKLLKSLSNFREHLVSGPHPEVASS